MAEFTPAQVEEIKRIARTEAGPLAGVQMYGETGSTMQTHLSMQRLAGHPANHEGPCEEVD